MTGATGFLGARLVGALEHGGAEVTAVARRASGSTRAADLSDLETARAVVASARPEVVFHLAACAWAAPRLELVGPTFDSGPLALVNLLRAVAETSPAARVVIPGSQNEPLPGSLEPPASPYAAAKAAEGLYASLFADVFGLAIVRLRLFLVYGPGQHEGKMIPSVARALLRGESPEIGNPDLALDWLYVDDAVDALLSASATEGVESARTDRRAGATRLSPIDVGTGTATPVRAIAERIADLVGGPARPRFAACAARPFEKSSAADPTHALEAFGFRSRVPLDEGLARTVAALRGT